jgi:hypothetical protein
MPFGNYQDNFNDRSGRWFDLFPRAAETILAVGW